MVTWLIPARHDAGCAFSQAMVAALVRPSTWASRPPVRVRVLGEDWSAPAGLVDAQDLHWWQWGRQRDPDVLNERVVHDGPVHAVVGCGLGDNSPLFGDRVPELGPQPCRQPRACPYCRQRLGERGTRA